MPHAKRNLKMCGKRGRSTRCNDASAQPLLEDKSEVGIFVDQARMLLSSAPAVESAAVRRQLPDEVGSRHSGKLDPLGQSPSA